MPIGSGPGSGGKFLDRKLNAHPSDPRLKELGMEYKDIAGKGISKSELRARYEKFKNKKGK